MPELSNTFGLQGGLGLFALLMSAAFLAGFVDSIVGGGGLIQIPTLFALFPGVAPALLFGTNKVASICGTSVAAYQYGRRVKLEWNAALPAALAALLMAFLGAFAVTKVPSGVLRGALPFVLVAVAVYTFVKKDFGHVHAPAHRGWREQIFGALVGGAIGFYDGFFGPGTGSFLIFVFIRFFGFGFLGASAAAKIVNVACNLAAIAWFAWSGNVWLAGGLAMAVFNVLGSIAGSRVALTRGTSFVRRLFLTVVVVLIGKTSYDAFLR